MPKTQSRGTGTECPRPCPKPQRYALTGNGLCAVRIRNMTKHDIPRHPGGVDPHGPGNRAEKI